MAKPFLLNKITKTSINLKKKTEEEKRNKEVEGEKRKIPRKTDEQMKIQINV